MILLTAREQAFLTRLSQLCEEFRAEFSYTTADDGIHISAEGKCVFVGFLCDGAAAELRRALRAHGTLSWAFNADQLERDLARYRENLVAGGRIAAADVDALVDQFKAFLYSTEADKLRIRPLRQQQDGAATT